MRVCECVSPCLPFQIPLPVQGEGKRAWRARVRAVATSTSLSTRCVKTGFVPKLLSPKVRAQAVENLFFNSPLQTLAVSERFFLPRSRLRPRGQAARAERIQPTRECFSLVPVIRPANYKAGPRFRKLSCG